MKVCGVDEAGRGPIIGPLVISGVLIDETASSKLKRRGVKDSKLLTHEKRKELFDKIIEVAGQFMILTVPSEEVDQAVMSQSLNLNWLEAQKTAMIINELMPQKAIVDAPSPNLTAYTAYLRKLLKNNQTELVVEHKADLNYVECAAASILAKVTRDEQIERLKERIGIDFGSGYLTDPLTQKFMKEHMENRPELFRKSWSPYKRAITAKLQKRLSEF